MFLRKFNAVFCLTKLKTFVNVTESQTKIAKQTKKPRCGGGRLAKGKCFYFAIAKISQSLVKIDVITVVFEIYFTVRGNLIKIEKEK